MLCCAIALYLFGRLYVGFVSLKSILTGRAPEIRENAASAWTRDAANAQTVIQSSAPTLTGTPRFRMGAALAVVLLSAGLPVLIAKAVDRAEAAPNPSSASVATTSGADATAYQVKER